MPKARLLRLDKLNNDYYALKKISDENKKLMIKINTINRLHVSRKQNNKPSGIYIHHFIFLWNW